MGSWSHDDLERINAEQDFHISVNVSDDADPKWARIWSVPVDDRIFIRSFNGTNGKWYGPALTSGRGRISAGGVERDVRFVPVPADDEATNQAIDESYRTKYAGSSAAETMATEPVRRNTIEVVPD